MRPFDKPALSVEQQLELLKQRGLQMLSEGLTLIVTTYRNRPSSKSAKSEIGHKGPDLARILEAIHLVACEGC